MDWIHLINESNRELQRWLFQHEYYHFPSSQQSPNHQTFPYLIQEIQLQGAFPQNHHAVQKASIDQSIIQHTICFIVKLTVK